MNNVAYIALGSNIGDRFFYLYEALSTLHEHEHISVVATSSIYETDPIGYVNQNCFLNMVAKVNTSLSPFQLLEVTTRIERKFGRTRDVRWGPRTLDLDILLYNQENIETEQLVIPHPRMFERAFVLVPLVEIDEHVHVPSLSTPLRLLVDQLPDRDGVRIWKRREENVFAIFKKMGKEGNDV